MSIFNMPLNKRNNLKNLIKNWDETMIWSCMQGYMGEVYTDNIENPKSVQFLIADFCFFAGLPNKELILNVNGLKSNFIIMTSNNSDWNKLIEEVHLNSKKRKRYAFKKEKDIFNRNFLEKIVNSLDPSYELKLIDEPLYNKVMLEDWSKDFCSQFLDADDFCKQGLGVVILYNNQIIAGASSYTVYNNGIEIEIDTKFEYRRRGLAYVSAAKLILECLDRGLYPSWDAHNLWSVSLAKKLGYHFDYEYTVYEVFLDSTEQL